MNRWAQRLLVAVAVLTITLAVLAGLALGLPLQDPDGFLGPSWFRLPVLILSAFVADIVPRAAWRSRRRPRSFLEHVREAVDDHWTRERATLVVLGLAAFFFTYVGYRNLKNFLPHLRAHTQDALLHGVDKALALGHEPAVLLHQALGESVAAHVLSLVYLFFLPFAPASLIVVLVWSRRVSQGYWFAAAHCLVWALGTASYYALPTLGPAFAYPWLYVDLDRTGVAAMQDMLYRTRLELLWNPLAGSVQDVAGFASLHVAVVLCAVLFAHFTVRQAWARRILWGYFVLTVVATLYFGWHYIADDLAGALIAVGSLWVGARAAGERMGLQRPESASGPLGDGTRAAAGAAVAVRRGIEAADRP